MIHRIAILIFCGLCLWTGRTTAQDQTVTDFNRSDATRGWQAVNDGVMGGLSEGLFRWNAETGLEFYGRLSLENNGGFASIRTGGQKISLKTESVIVLRVRGDGREYSFNLYSQGDRYAYRQTFQTVKNEWVEIELPLKGFEATWRGRRFPQQRLNPGRISGMGFQLGDKKPGPFRLDVEWIKTRELAKVDGEAG